MGCKPEAAVFVVSANDPMESPIGRMLEALDYSVVGLSLEALTSASAVKPDVVVIMPNGWEPATLKSTLIRIRDAWDTSVLVVDRQEAPTTLPSWCCDLGVARIAENVSEKELASCLDNARVLCHLQSQLRHYRQLLQIAPVGVFEIMDGRLSYVNDYLLERTGYALEEIREIPLDQLLVPEDRDRLAQALRDLPDRPANAPPNIYRFLAANQQTFIGEVRSVAIAQKDGFRIEGTIRDITQETRIMQLHRIVLELTEVILAEQDIDRILQLVLDTIVEYGGFRRALLTLYDLSIPCPFEGPVFKTMTSGLTPDEQAALMAQEEISIEQRREVYSDRFKLGLAYYIPHDETPLSKDHGITGTVSVDGWHPDDFLFLPLRGDGGIIGTISIDDPMDPSVPTAASIEPVAFLANIAAFAVERVFKMKRLRKQANQLHGLAALGSELATINNERALCETTATRVQEGMDYEICGIYLLDGMRFVHEATSVRDDFPKTEIPEKGDRVVAEGPGINRWVLKNGKPAIIPDVSKDSLYAGPREAIQSYIAVPIIGRKGSIGVIYAASQRLAAFGEQDCEILSTVTSHLATALTAVRRQTSLNRIFDFGQQLAVASTHPQAVASTLDFLVEQFDFQLASILMLQEDGSLVASSAGGAFSDRHIEAGWETSRESGIIGWVAWNKTSLIVPDVSQDARYKEVLSSTRSELAVPILFDRSLLGVVNIESAQLGFFDDEDRRLIEVVANQLATALANISSQATLREQAIRDPLTGLFNRHYFNSIIASEFSRSDRYERPLSLMMLDVDGFRAVNNTLGHLKGDEVLQSVARMIESNVRDCDRVIRYGGDEFLVFMPETDEHGTSHRVAARLRSGIGAVLGGTDAGKLRLVLGLSIGIYSRLPGEQKTLEQILEEVDRRMYADKRAQNEDRADEYRR
ncbi:diguanylate cyclase [Candidatus Bipolaricaulota bacterium]|nr:diguanylate cyclase [Candidatus Bipolaricaulota bacterium]TFH09831.1 MAG: diguanylate cyclase [Candidatus Atribacteria bacterium]